MDILPLQDLINIAAEQSRAAQAASDAAADAIQAAMQRLLPPGTVIDLRVPKGLPEYLILVRTAAGRDHGTRVFRIEQFAGVSFNPLQPELAKWFAYATPISEKTGKDMDGRAPHAVSRHGKTVRIAGDISVDRDLEEPLDERLARMIAMLERA